jgi:hypothetical protein
VREMDTDPSLFVCSRKLDPDSRAIPASFSCLKKIASRSRRVDTTIVLEDCSASLGHDSGDPCEDTRSLQPWRQTSTRTRRRATQVMRSATPGRVEVMMLLPAFCNFRHGHAE